MLTPFETVIAASGGTVDLACVPQNGKRLTVLPAQGAKWANPRTTCHKWNESPRAEELRFSSNWDAESEHEQANCERPVETERDRKTITGDRTFLGSKGL